MQKSEYMLFTVRFGDNNLVQSVTRSGETIFEQVKLSVVLDHLDLLKSEGWEVMTVRPFESGEIYELRKAGA